MAAYPTHLSVDDARGLLRELAAARRMPVESLATARADGRVLAADVVAEVSLPAFDNSAMDGFALRHADAARGRLRLVGEQFAGRADAAPLGEGECVRITTGAPLPPGADTILMRELAREADGWVSFEAAPAPGSYVRRAGEDVRGGDVVLRAGHVLTAARIGLAAAVGRAQVPVHARPTVAVFATGDELVEPGLPLAPGQIYNANRDLLMARLRELGFTPVAWPTLPDDPARMETVLRDAAAAFDVILTCGGVSAGEKDHLPALLARIGRIHFWKIRMRPGMPLLCGELDRAVLLGLPGNPVSVLATFTAFAQPLLEALQGRTEPAPRLYAALDAPWDKRHARLELLRGHLHCDPSGQLRVTPNPADASHRLRGAADSDVLLVLDEGTRTYAVGEVVEVIRY